MKETIAKRQSMRNVKYLWKKKQRPPLIAQFARLTRQGTTIPLRLFPRSTD